MLFKLSALDAASAIPVGGLTILREVRRCRTAEVALLPHDFDDIEHIDWAIGVFLRSLQNLHEWRDVPRQQIDTAKRLVSLVCIRAESRVVERESAKPCGVFETVEDRNGLVAAVVAVANVDVAKVFRHGADTVQEDLQVAEVGEMEVVVAVQNRSGLLVDFLAELQDGSVV